MSHLQTNSPRTSPPHHFRVFALLHSNTPWSGVGILGSLPCNLFTLFMHSYPPSWQLCLNLYSLYDYFRIFDAFSALFIMEGAGMTVGDIQLIENMFIHLIKIPVHTIGWCLFGCTCQVIRTSAYTIKTALQLLAKEMG